MTSILIIEDEPRIASFLEKGLRSNGFTTASAPDGMTGLRMARSDEFDLVVLDLGLPDIDGMSVLAELRRAGRSMPVIILTARDGVQHTVAGLEGGADDYLTKPFKFDELLARVRARLRSGGPRESSTVGSGGVMLDLQTRRATVDGHTVDLTAREFTLAEALLRHPDQVLSREQLLSRVWGYDYDPGSNVVDVYVGYLRRKFGQHRIVTVRGMGYRFVENPPASGAES